MIIVCEEDSKVESGVWNVVLTTFCSQLSIFDPWNPYVLINFFGVNPFFQCLKR